MRPPRRYGPRPQGRERLRRLGSGAAVVLVVAGGAYLGLKLSGTDTGPLARLQGPPHAPGPLAGQVLAPSAHEMYWGAYTAGGPYERGAVDRLIRDAGAPPAILMWYQEWLGTPDFPAAEANWLRDRGIVPMITWEPWRPPSIPAPAGYDPSTYSLKNIASGGFDGYMHSYARQIRAYGGPVMLRPMHEMDGFWYPWGGTVGSNTPAQYVAAWRHMHDIFEAEGATNVTWVWSVNFESIPRTEENRIQNYWPGPSYVDWVGISGFNRGDTQTYSDWTSFQDIVGDRYRDLLRYHKPIAVTETGAPESGGDKARWIEGAFRSMEKRFPELKMVIWYDQKDSLAEDWRIASSAQAMQAFRAAVSRSDVLSADAALATAEKD